MLLTITLIGEQATDLGFLLGKHPDRVHRTELSWGHATVCFPVAQPRHCTATMIVEVDPVGLVRRGDPSGSTDGCTLGRHVNDRPYAASSLLSVAISRTLGSALHGRCRERPELAAAALRLELGVPVVRDADGLAERMFVPLGWRVAVTPVGARHVGLRLTGAVRLADALCAVYVLLPVLDDAKHHHVGPDEADKLLRAGESWLPGHPERELITRRYLRYQTPADGAGGRASRHPRRRRPARPPAARTAPRRGPRRAADRGRAPGARPRVRRGAAARRPAARPGVHRGRRGRHRGGRPGAGRAAAAPRRAAARRAFPDHAAAGLARLHRPFARRVRRRRAQRGRRACGAGPTPVAGARGVRRRPPRHGGRHDAEPRVQRPLPRPPGGRVPAP